MTDNTPQADDDSLTHDPRVPLVPLVRWARDRQLPCSLSLLTQYRNCLTSGLTLVFVHRPDGVVMYTTFTPPITALL